MSEEEKEEKGPRRLIKFIHSIAKDGVVDFRIEKKTNKKRTDDDV